MDMPIPLLRSIALFLTAGLLEIGGCLALPDEVFARFNVVACFVDPSHAVADEEDLGAIYTAIIASQQSQGSAR